MSSTIRHVAALRLPDQNSSRKCTHAWINGANNNAWLTFSCAEGVYELMGDSSLASAEDVISAVSYYYDGVFACRYMGGLRVVTSFGPNMQQILRNYLGYGGDAEVSVLVPGISSRVLMIDNRENDSGFNTEAVIEGSYAGGFLSDSDYLNRNADTWVVKEPLVFSIEGDEYFYVNPIGDDVYSHNYEPYESGISVRALAPTLTQQQQRVRSMAVGLRPRNESAKNKLIAASRRMLAAAAPAPEPSA